jgi:transcriptional regulator with XRE-family HTH domain
MKQKNQTKQICKMANDKNPKTGEDVGLTIRLLRKEQNRTLKDVASVASISTSYLAEIERDESKPDLARIVEICNVLNVDPFAVLLKASVEKDLPLEKRKLLREYKPILKKLNKMIAELYDDDDDDDEMPRIQELDLIEDEA